MEAATTTGALPEQEAEAPESGFEIDGKMYHVPTVDTINLDEERILYVYADTVVEDLIAPHPGTTEDEQLLYNLNQFQRIRNPDFKRALAHIAYKREHPEVSDEDIQATIGAVKAIDMDIAMLRAERAEPDPTMGSPTSSESERSENADSSQKRQQPEFTTTGRGTENGSDSPAPTLSPTGTLASDTSSESSPAIVA